MHIMTTAHLDILYSICHCAQCTAYDIAW